MSRLTRIVVLSCLPILTLALGWNLGVQFEREALQEREDSIAELFSVSSASGAILGDPEKEVDISLLWSVWRLLQSHYIATDNLRPQNMVYGATKGMVESLGDQYTTFMTPEENTQFHDSLDGHLQGIGAELALRNGLVVVVSPLKGSPAERAGLLPEDVITQVDGGSVEGMNLSEVVTKIRGKKGTKVTLSILRSGETEERSVTITRDTITVPSVESEVKNTATGAVAYIAVNQFGGETFTEMVRALQTLERNDDLQGLILDLRYNGGGYLTGAVEMSSLFLREGKVVSVERRIGEPQRHYVTGRPMLPDIPMVVLINQGSASASEIVAGALQDLKRATIIGEKSFGKGTVQEVIDLPGGSSLRVTAARWLTPNGRDLGKEGVLPDIPIERTTAELQAGYDPQLEAALEYLTEGQGG